MGSLIMGRHLHQKDSTVESHNKIITMFERNVPVGKICKEVNLSRSQVYRYIRRHIDSSHLCERPILTKKRPGAKKKIENELEDDVVSYVSAKPSSSCRMIKDDLKLNCHHSTVWRSLERNGIFFKKSLENTEVPAEQQNKEMDSAPAVVDRKWVAAEPIETVYVDETVSCSSDD